MTRSSPKTPPRRAAKVRRQALLVLGMHRSGTSAVAGMLARLGAQLPRTLMPAAKDNPTGFFESTELQRFHDQLLKSAGSRWNDWSPFSPDWAGSTVGEQFADLLPPLIDSEFGSARLLLIKDPRISRFLPFWMQVLGRLGIEPKIVLPVRDPHEVADSLEARNDFDHGYSLLIWLRHVLEAERASRSLPRALVSYTDLLEDWRAQATRMGSLLGVSWPRRASAAEAEIDEYLSAEMRHQAPGGVARANAQIETWIGEVYGALQDLIGGKRPAASIYRDLDRVRRDFDRSGAVFAGVMRGQEKKLDAARNEVRDLNKQLEEKTASMRIEISNLSKQLEEKTASMRIETSNLSKQLEEKARKVAELQASLAQRDKQAALEAAKAAAAAQAKAALQQEQNAAKAAAAAQAKAELHQARVQEQNAVKAAAGAQAKVELLQARVQEQNAALAKLRSDHAGQIRKLGELSGRLQASEKAWQRQRAIESELRSTVERARERADGLAKTASEQQRKLGELQAKLQKSERALSHGATKLAASQAALTKVQAALRASRESAAQQAARIPPLRTKVAALEQRASKLQAQNAENARSLAARFREIALLTKALAEREGPIASVASAAPSPPNEALRGAPSLKAIRRALSR